MDRRSFIAAGSTILLANLLNPASSFGGGRQVVRLPAPTTTGGLPLMDCLQNRHTDRRLGSEDLPLPEISNILWAAFGVNREDGRHVVPTARNQQKVAVFAVLGDGVWRYLPEQNSIEKVVDGDRRKNFDGSSLILLYAAPSSDIFGGMHVGSMYQNVGLYCASQGFPNCVKYTGHDFLDKELPLPQGWKVLITQSVGSKIN